MKVTAEYVDELGEITELNLQRAGVDGDYAEPFGLVIGDGDLAIDESSAREPEAYGWYRATRKLPAFTIYKAGEIWLEIVRDEKGELRLVRNTDNADV